MANELSMVSARTTSKIAVMKNMITRDRTKKNICVKAIFERLIEVDNIKAMDPLSIWLANNLLPTTTV
jgi:hypothetical protein